jgi:hypothetical protein
MPGSENFYAASFSENLLSEKDAVNSEQLYLSGKGIRIDDVGCGKIQRRHRNGASRSSGDLPSSIAAAAGQYFIAMKSSAST